MNPAKRKKLARLQLAEESKMMAAKENSPPKTEVAVKLGLQEMQPVVELKQESDEQEQLTLPESMSTSEETTSQVVEEEVVSLPVESKKKKKS